MLLSAHVTHYCMFPILGVAIRYLPFLVKMLHCTVGIPLHSKQGSERIISFAPPHSQMPPGGCWSIDQLNPSAKKEIKTTVHYVPPHPPPPYPPWQSDCPVRISLQKKNLFSVIPFFYADKNSSHLTYTFHTSYKSFGLPPTSECLTPSDPTASLQHQLKWLLFAIVPPVVYSINILVRLQKP